MPEKDSIPDKKRGEWLLPAVIGAVCALLASCYVFFMFHSGRIHKSIEQSKAGPSTVRLGTFSTAIDYAPFLAALDKGWIQQQLPDTKIQTTTFQTLPSINEAFAAHQIDVVFEAEVPAIVGRSAGIDLRIVALDATLKEGVLSTASSSISRVADLKGRRVAVLYGSAMHYGLISLLRQAGLNNRSVSIINMAPQDASAAFASHQLDAWAVWPPWPEQQVLAGGGRFIPNSTIEVQSVVVMDHKFVQEHAEEARGIVSAIDQAKAWLGDHPDEGTSLVAKNMNLPISVVRLAWPKHAWGAIFDSEVDGDIQAKADFLLSEHMIEHGVKIQDLISPVQDVQ